MHSLYSLVSPLSQNNTGDSVLYPVHCHCNPQSLCYWFLSTWHKPKLIWEEILIEKIPLLDRPVGKFVGPFPWLTVNVGRPSSLWQSQSWAGVSGVHKKTKWLGCEEQASKQYSSVACSYLQAPALSSWLDFLWWCTMIWNYKLKQTLSSPSCLGYSVLS